jgi:hypothetical protein
MTGRYANAMSPANRAKSAARPGENRTYLASPPVVVAEMVFLGPRRPRALSLQKGNGNGTLKVCPETVACTGPVRPWRREWATL